MAVDLRDLDQPQSFEPQARASIRGATINDLPDIAVVNNASFGSFAYPPHVLREFLDVFSYTMLVAENNGVIVGYAILAPTSTTSAARLLSIAVSTGARNHGIGTALVERVLYLARVHGLRSVRASVNAHNGFQRILRRAGFERYPELNSFYGDGEPRLTYEIIIDRRQTPLS